MLQIRFIFAAVKKGLRKTFNIDYKPTILIADAARIISNGFEQVFGSEYVRVMCWFHMRKAVVEKLPKLSSDKKKTISPSQEVFNHASLLFTEKWRAMSQSFFDDYFTNVWLIDNRFWYEGAAMLAPSTNNALESFNRYLKDEHTLRERIDLGQLRSVLFEAIEKWSLAYTNDLKEYKRQPDISLKLWTASYSWAKMNLSMNNKNNADEMLYTFSTNPSVPGECSSWKTFDDYKNSLSDIQVSFPLPYTKENWLAGRCTCKEYLKNYICTHIVGISIRMKYVIVPDEAKNIPIGQKRKRGRPALAKAALVIQ